MTSLLDSHLARILVVSQYMKEVGFGLKIIVLVYLYFMPQSSFHSAIYHGPVLEQHSVLNFIMLCFLSTRFSELPSQDKSYTNAMILSEIRTINEMKYPAVTFTSGTFAQT